MLQRNPELLCKLERGWGITKIALLGACIVLSSLSIGWFSRAYYDSSVALSSHNTLYVTTNVSEGLQRTEVIVQQQSKIMERLDNVLSVFEEFEIHCKSGSGESDCTINPNRGNSNE